MSELQNKYHCNDHLKGNVKNLGQVCPRCLIAIYNKSQRLLEFVKECAEGEEYLNSISIKYAIPSGLPDISMKATDLLKEIGEL